MALTIPHDEPIILIPYQNGGWTINVQSMSYEQGRQLGAYSNATAMLTALAEALLENQDFAIFDRVPYPVADDEGTE